MLDVIYVIPSKNLLINVIIVGKNLLAIVAYIVIFTIILPIKLYVIVMVVESAVLEITYIVINVQCVLVKRDLIPIHAFLVVIMITIVQFVMMIYGIHVTRYQLCHVVIPFTTIVSNKI